MIWYFIAYYVIGVVCSIWLSIHEENYGLYLTLGDLLLSIFIAWAFAPICVLFYICSKVSDCLEVYSNIRVWEKK